MAATVSTAPIGFRSHDGTSQIRPLIWAPQLLGAGHALPVAHVVARAHREAAAHQVAREPVVASQVLGHAVHDLHDAARRGRARACRTLGCPDQAPDLGRAIVREGAVTLADIRALA